MLLFFSTLSLTFTSCGDDKEKDEPIPEELIIGKWICKDFDVNCDYIMCFNDNGRGWMQWTDEGDEKNEFTYRVHGDYVTFYEEGDSWRCEYEIRNKNKVIFYNNPWGEDDDIQIVHLIRM